MNNQLENKTAIYELVRQLTKHRPLDADEVRQQCTRVIYTCFLMGIEPFQLPITEDCAGNLSEAQRSNFLQRYLLLQLDSASMDSAVSQLSCCDPVSSLIQLIDEIIDTRKAT